LPELIATYRVQLTPTFGFDDAAAIVHYLAELGVSHVYCSPYLQAAPGSTHGYDVVDHSELNRELGGPAAHGRMCVALAAAGLGQVLDIVPNHMAVAPENAWWEDVLENGPASRYAAYFDVDWDPPERKLRNTVLVPVLADHYGRVLEQGELSVGRAGGHLHVSYGDRRWPLAPPTYAAVLGPAAAAIGDAELAFVARSFEELPPASVTDREQAAVRHRDKEVLKRRFVELCDAHPGVAVAVDREVAALNADVDRLDALLDRQNFRLAYWRTAGEDLDYRRFFDINDLVALHTEDRRVFDDTHALVLQLVRDGRVEGLRVDHPDGLADVRGYFERLRASAPDAWIVAEKILEPGEQLPTDWGVDGTTGYDFLNRALAVLVDRAGEVSLTEAYAAFTRAPADWADVARTAKRAAVESTLAADVRRLTDLLVEVCEAQRRYRDFTRWDLRAALVEVLVAFPLYRTYVQPGLPVSGPDARVVEGVLADVTARRPDVDPDLLGLLRRVLRGEVPGPGAALCTRLQQTTGPVMAKGVEDTALYRYTRLAAVCEVGGDPGTVGATVDQFHRWMAEAERLAPRSMLAGTTHDTKRSEDVRARLALLAEIPREFALAVAGWSSLRPDLAIGDRNLEWLLYQTFVGAWPLPVDRAVAYASKAAREAKQHTSWTDPSPDFEARVVGFVEGMLGDERFAAELEAFVRPLLVPGWANSLSFQLLRLLSPGVPDVYQGTELWDLSLVDPDNRRPVDWEVRRRLLAELEGLDAAAVWARVDEGLPKLHLTRAALAVRRRGLGRYSPLHAGDHAIAFCRGDDVVAVASRLPLRRARRGGWREDSVVLPDGRWWDELSGREVPGGRAWLDDLLAPFPVALLTRTAS
jgi:(1->4)-alpha-D-glucan 1-alpha-D-glucosylmutase